MGISVKIAIVTVAHGATYRDFLPRWAESIAHLQRQPDEVIIVTDDVADAARASAWIPVRIKRTETSFERHAQLLVNQGIAATDADWIVKLDADDLIYPHALNALDFAEGDVFMFGVSVNGKTPIPAKSVEGQDILAAGDNLLHAASPFRRWVWEKSSGFQDMLYDDWAFWREAASNGAKFQASATIDYEYRLEGHNATLGIDHGKEVRRVMEHVH